MSGAWRRWPDTMVRVRAERKHRTIVTWEKTRHSSVLHGVTMTLAWAIDSEGFELVDTETALAVERAERVDDALDWILDDVAREPGRARSVVEQAYVDSHRGKGRNLARVAIDTALAAETGGEHSKALATGPGKAANGTYLYPASADSSPLAASLFGEDGEQAPALAERECSPLAAPPKGSEREVASSEQGGHDEELQAEVERVAELLDDPEPAAVR